MLGDFLEEAGTLLFIKDGGKGVTRESPSSASSLKGWVPERGASPASLLPSLLSLTSLFPTANLWGYGICRHIPRRMGGGLT